MKKYKRMLPCLVSFLLLPHLFFISSCFSGLASRDALPPSPAYVKMQQNVLVADDPDSFEDEGEFNTEEYERIYENPFLETISNPLSTFSIDVDTASYSNMRRFLNSGQLPYPDAIRIEECLNYFTYDYPEPSDDTPFTFNTELSTCPWNTEHRLLLIGLQAKKISLSDLPPNNLVFLLDVSGSMESPNKLPLLKTSLKLLVNEMREIDTVAVVVYAGAAGLVLPPASGVEKQTIMRALDMLSAGGSTAGGEGIKCAYAIAHENFLAGGNNRVILATDGDFNVGPSSDAELVRLIEEERKKGIFLTVLGFGMGNIKDSKMEKLADAGNGNYAYIDTITEAKKVLVTEMGGTLLTIAKDVKIQIEFNPVRVESYRLIGYENRLLRAEDFADDTKDAGELGAGHTVTVLYELVMSAGGEAIRDDLRYVDTTVNNETAAGNELLFIKFRYKKPDEDESILIQTPVLYVPVPPGQSSENFRFSTAVAELCLLLRDSTYKADASFENVIGRASEALGQDRFGYRKEFIELVKKARSLMLQK